MFLHTIAQHRLQDTDGQLYVLRNVDQNTSLQLCTTMITFLHQQQNERNVLTSEPNVDWLLQIVGHAFSLAIKSGYRTIYGAIDIYERWINPDTQPEVIRDNARVFTQKMCCHLSFVFQDRHIDFADNAESFKHHVNLCRRVLRIYSESARRPPHGVDQAEWNGFLSRLFLGIADELMKGPSVGRRTLGNEIEQDVFFVMFDIWLRSRMQDAQMWHHLQKLGVEWLHRRWFVESWGQSCVALTRRIIHHLYQGDNGSEWVYVKWPVLGTTSVSINAMLGGRGSAAMAPSGQAKLLDRVLPSEHDDASDDFGYNSVSRFGAETSGQIRSGEVRPMATFVHLDDPRLLIYLWKEMLQVIDTQKLNDPNCFAIAIAWVARMVDMFIKVTVTVSQRSRGIISPDGNSILQIFCQKLLGAAVKMKGFEDARAIALGALCRIFCQRSHTVFEEQYRQSFYNVLCEALIDIRNVNRRAREQIIMNGATLFSCDFPGARTLAGIFLSHLEDILTLSQNPRLRLASITMLCSFVSLSWHFIPPEKREGGTSQVKKMKTRLDRLSIIIARGIKSENNEYNLQKLMWISCVYLETSVNAVEVSNGHATFPSLLIQTVWQHIRQGARHWTPHVVLMGLKTLKSIPSLNKVFSKCDDLCARIIVEMCDYALENLKPDEYRGGGRTKFDPEIKREIGVACVKCLLTWLRAGPWMLTTSDVSQAVRNLAHRAITICSDVRMEHERKEHEQVFHSPAMRIQATGSASNARQLWKELASVSDRLARHIVCDAGSYSDVVHVPLQRYGATNLCEKHVEDYIFRMIHNNPNTDPMKWSPQDRIRYFLYKGERIITLIEMPRFTAGAERNITARRSDPGSGSVTAVTPVDEVQVDRTQREECDADVVIIVRDAYGKYAWETKSVWNEPVEPIEMKGDPDPFVPKRDSYNQMTMDMMERAVEKSQQLAQQSFRRPDERANSEAIIWTSSHISEKWDEHTALNPETQEIMSTMRTQFRNEQAITAPDQIPDDMPRPRFMGEADKYSAAHAPPLPPQDDVATFLHSRRLFSCLGFLSPINPNSEADHRLGQREAGLPAHLQILDASIQNLEEQLEELDRIPVSDRVTCSIIYRTGNQLSDVEMIKNVTEDHSPEFAAFLEAFGAFVPIRTHTGYCGHLKEEDVSEFPYWADVDHELAVYVPSMFRDADYARRRALFLTTCVRIVWCDSSQPLYLSQQYLPTSERHPRQNTPVVYIRITEQESGLYRISVHSDSILPHLQNMNSTTKRETTSFDRVSAEDPENIVSELSDHVDKAAIPSTFLQKILIGPLVDAMVVSADVLPILVRKTVLSAHDLISSLLLDNPYSFSARARTKQIQTIQQNYARPIPQSFYRFFFTDPTRAYTQKRRSNSVIGSRAGS